jgi:hypothetical protein
MRALNETRSLESGGLNREYLDSSKKDFVMYGEAILGALFGGSYWGSY